VTSDDDTLATRILPVARDLGDGFVVRRALPAKARRMVGPFIFFDQMGPTLLRPGIGLDVRPHPHIGLATLTYLLQGEILHRDSLGTVQAIRPGAVNWMVAGRGIVHSERTPPEARAGGSALFGLQCWIALPLESEEAAPSFAHHGAHELPELRADGVSLRLIVGTLGGARSPVATFSGMVYAEAQLAEGARLPVTPEHEERGAYVLSGAVALGSAVVPAGEMLVFREGTVPVLRAEGGPARLMLLGGAPVEGQRHLWWNFVASSTERLEQAKADWRAGRFPAVPGETEFIPLPE
jgi:redox-sensitive bicupin YhaK (pirin superfamily)